MSGHTQGPWSTQHVYGNCYSVKCASGQYHIGTIRGKHNASMISAIPDLLAVAKELEESASYWSEYDVPLGIVDRLRAAIAKAEPKAEPKGSTQ